MLIKYLSLLILLCGINFDVFAQENYNLMQEGINLLEQKKYGEAEAAFKKIIANTDTVKEAYFNLGNTVYQQGRFEEARENYKKLLPLFDNKNELAEAYHNIGNTFMAEKKWEESIKSFKNALRNNPADMDTKYNLAFAQEMLKEQQQEEQENKKDEEDKKDEKDEKKDSEEEKKDENKEEQKDKGEQEEKKDEGKKDENKEGDQDKKDADQGKDQEAENGEEKEGEGTPKPQKLSKEEAERMLRAIEAQEQKLQDKKKQEEMTPVRINTDKDW